MMGREIVVMQQQGPRLSCSLYKLGYDAQQEVKRSELRNMLAQPTPPVAMYLHAKHFDALVAQRRESYVFEVSD